MSSSRTDGRGRWNNRMTVRGPRRRSGGQSTVEFAATVLVFLLLLIGIINFGLAIYAYTFVSYAARDATRYASVRGSQSPAPATPSEVAAVVTGEATSLNTNDLTVNTTWSPNDNPGSTVQVEVSYTFNFTAPFTALGPLDVSSTSRMIISQ